MFILLLCLSGFLLCLIYERITLDRCLKRIPLRIAVTGTRGKSSVARILASVLTESGKKVLTKTTGSQATILLPGGDEIELRRWGSPSILEQIRAVRMASRHGADCLVAEIMSIHPENHRIEAQRILRPHLIAVTNVRLDHTEAMGDTKEEIASVLSLDVAPRASVFVPEGAPHCAFEDAAARAGGAVVKVPLGISSVICEDAPELRKKEFQENLDLAYSVASHLNIGRADIVRGILNARHDIGRLKVWRSRSRKGAHSYYLVNAFAANDPESTFETLSRVLESLPGSVDRVFGLLNLRPDRLPRTLQWIEALQSGGLSRFDKLFVTGSHCALVKKRLPGTQVLKDGLPEAMMAPITAGIPQDGVVFGFGNIKNAGARLVAYWDRIGEIYGI